MTDTVDWEGRLRARSPSDWVAFLNEHSGLPGPRANLALAHAAARLADADLIAVLEATGDEYCVMCAAAARGARADAAENEQRSRTWAADSRWRVREGVAIGLQLLGDRDIAALIHTAKQWAQDADPLVQRAALVALCEPRLLREPAVVVDALELCRAMTSQFAVWPSSRCRTPEARTLRQALGYCWSVVVAANPGIALSSFLDLDSVQPDVAWIIRENLRKSRLTRIMQP